MKLRRDHLPKRLAVTGCALAVVLIGMHVRTDEFANRTLAAMLLALAWLVDFDNAPPLPFSGTRRGPRGEPSLPVTGGRTNGSGWALVAGGILIAFAAAGLAVVLTVLAGLGGCCR